MLKWAFVALAVIGICVALFVARHKQKTGLCDKAKVVFNVEPAQQFVSEEAILKHLKSSRFTWEKAVAREIDLTKAEHILRKQAFIKKVDCYMDLTNTLVIEITQREPIVRVFPKYGLPYYIDDEGGTFPLSNLFSADVVVASGNINVSVNKKLYTLATIVHHSAFWEPFIEHIFVRDNGDLVLTTQISGHQVILGSANRVEGKLAKLETFYTEALAHMGWDQFKEINLEYKDQVICRK